MPSRKAPPEPKIEPRQFRTVEEIDQGIKKLERRIEQLEKLDVKKALFEHSGEDDVVESDIHEAIREVFGSNSPEFHEHQYLRIWAGPIGIGMSSDAVVYGTEQGRIKVRGILQGLIDRLREKRQDLTSATAPSPRTYLHQLNLHPRIADVANDLFQDGHAWEAAFAASKALINYVKERSGRDDLDGVSLMRTVFSKNSPRLAFNDLKDQTDLDEQEGMMHLFEGAVFAIRNPGGHSFPEGPEQRALEYISLLSLLAYRLQEANKRT